MNEKGLNYKLVENFEYADIQALSATEDVDTLIVQAAINEAYNNPIAIVVRQDTYNCSPFILLVKTFNF